ncbi:hypothetical protein GCM10011380_26220 [Sphingomonas metalli]|uniref:DUF4105 domain-containing protein n=1 Tax=Sphingomonas metalli TaxID=1779358 RepID=A0A916T9U8_9SPHN|nr:hypothetical protein [Sphingomonas metalli]GGB35576.1 hypothetical protein GCM10011380_26220 [Sphingomonas metalli]
MNALARTLALLALWLVALPAQAAVTATFWSHELGNSFPHAFFTLRGTPDAGGPPVDIAYGFTARSLSPAILMGTVKGRLESAKPAYIRGSDAQFAVVLSDAQYASLLALARAWSEEGGDSSYNLNHRNCVHFVREAARRIGLTGLDQPALMKKPRSFLKAVAAANTGKVIALGIPGKAYLATLPPLR